MVLDDSELRNGRMYYQRRRNKETGWSKISSMMGSQMSRKRMSILDYFDCCRQSDVMHGGLIHPFVCSPPKKCGKQMDVADWRKGDAAGQEAAKTQWLPLRTFDIMSEQLWDANSRGKGNVYTKRSTMGRILQWLLQATGATFALVAQFQPALTAVRIRWPGRTK